MNRPIAILMGAALILAFATVMLIVIPGFQVHNLETTAYLDDYTQQELRGRQVYMSQGCVYCHSQQPRSFGQTPADMAKGWGRASTPADYVYDKPHLLGTMRTGPDLLNVGARLPSQAWHLTHLFQPRAIFEWSLMPAYPYLFEVKNQAMAEDVVVKLPKSFKPEGKLVVAKQSALDLVAYLQSLDRTYPVADKEQYLRDQGFDGDLEGDLEKATQQEVKDESGQ